jgi:hypothetical protein
MCKLLEKATQYLPRINFSLDGYLVLEGRAMPKDAAELFDPMIEFVSLLKTDEVQFKVNLEYVNTASKKKLLELFKKLDANKNVSKINIYWYFEEDDKCSVETAERFEDLLLRSQFHYIEQPEII